MFVRRVGHRERERQTQAGDGKTAERARSHGRGIEVSANML
jgi:hypothetical protein